jgi:hypothetical protein
MQKRVGEAYKKLEILFERRDGYKARVKELQEKVFNNNIRRAHTAGLHNAHTKDSPLP